MHLVIHFYFDLSGAMVYLGPHQARFVAMTTTAIIIKIIVKNSDING